MPDCDSGYEDGAVPCGAAPLSMWTVHIGGTATAGSGCKSETSGKGKHCRDGAIVNLGCQRNRRFEVAATR